MESVNNAVNGVSTLRFDNSSMHEVSGEFTLPDYMPEVRRILCCTARVLPERKYPSPGNVELSGLVVYSVLYAGDDGALSSAPLNSEYSVIIPLKDEDGTVGAESIGVFTTVESTSCRAVGPRRLVISSRLLSRLFSSEITGTEMKVTNEGENNCEIEVKKTSVKNSSFLFGTETGSVSGELREREGTRMLACDSAVCVESVQPTDRGIDVRGEAHITFFEMTPEGEYRTVRVKAPVSESISIDKYLEYPNDREYKAVAMARPASATVNGDDFGVFSWELEYDIDGELIITGDSTVTEDAYSVNCFGRTETEVLPVLSLNSSGVSSLTVSTSETVSGYENKSVVKSSAKVIYEKYETREDGKIILIGNCIICVISVGDGDAVSKEIAIPVRFETGAMTARSPVVLCTMNALYSDAVLNGDKLNVTAEICVTYTVVDTEKTEAVKELITDGEGQCRDNGNRVTVYYPEEDETMWSIGKKYRCSASRIHGTTNGKAVMIY